MDALQEWVANANEAITIELIGKDGSSVGTFHPKFTYPIFGDAESIYGYKDLALTLKFDATTLLPFVEMEYSEELPLEKVKEEEKEAQKEIKKEVKEEDSDGEQSEEKNGSGDEANDIDPNPVKQLLKFMPESLPETVDDWETKRHAELSDILSALGEPVSSFTSGAEEYNVYKTTLQKSLSLHQRMKLFVLLFIEAGSYIDESDDRWELYVVYRKRDMVFAGFSTVYQYMWYLDHTQHDASTSSLDSIRKRISQFVILPAFQSLGLGSHLYSLLMERFLEDDNVKEVTIEDPSEAFDDLRDRCDLQRLAQNGVWEGLVLPVDPEWVTKTRSQQKMAPRQFDRCVEMAALHNLGYKSNNKKYRLAVKKRIFIRNREALQELDLAQRFDKLQETFMRLTEDYDRILKKVDFSSDRKGKKRVAESDSVEA